MFSSRITLLLNVLPSGLYALRRREGTDILVKQTENQSVSVLGQVVDGVLVSHAQNTVRSVIRSEVKQIAWR